MARLVNAGTLKLHGSDHTTSPGGIVIEGAPWKVSGVSVEVLMTPLAALPVPAASAMWTEFIVTRFVP